MQHLDFIVLAVVLSVVFVWGRKKGLIELLLTYKDIAFQIRLDNR